MQVRSLFRHRDFLLLWSGQAVSTLGTSISTLALPLLVLAFTRSPAQAGLIAAFQLVPYLCLSLPAGALIDRWNRKWVMILCDSARAAAYGSVPIALALGHITVVQLYLVAGVSGVAFVFFDVAQISALAHVVAQDALTQANALNDVAISIATLLGPGLSGLIISLTHSLVAGCALAYAFDSCSFVVSVVSLLFIRTPFQEDQRAVFLATLWGDIREGVGFVWRERRLRVVALLIASIGVLSSFTYLATIVLARDAFHADARTLGLIFSIGSGVGLLGAFVAPWAQKRFSFAPTIAGAVFVEGAACVLMGSAINPLLLIVGLSLISLAIPVFGAVELTYRLSLTPDTLQGRVNSLIGMLFFGGQPLGTALGGLLLPSLGPRLELWLVGAGLMLSALAAGAVLLQPVENKPH